MIKWRARKPASDLHHKMELCTWQSALEGLESYEEHSQSVPRHTPDGTKKMRIKERNFSVLIVLHG